MKYRRQIWDDVAQDYDVIWEVPDYSPVLMSIVDEAKIDSGKKVLDVATGTGMVGIEVANKLGDYGSVLGIDLERSMLEQAIRKKKSKNIRNIDFILADAHSLPLVDGYFDVITSCFSFAFFYDPKKAAKEMGRVLTTEGRTILVEWEKPPLDFWAEIRKKAGIRDFAEAELIKILYDSGFRKIRTKRIEVLYRRPNISDDLVKKFQLLSARLMNLGEGDVTWFFSKIREENQKLPPEEKRRGWLPVLYVGAKH